MAASGTVLSAGSVTVHSTGGATGDLLFAINKLAASLTQVIVTAADNSTGIPAAPDTLPAGSIGYELVIDPGYTGSLSIPPASETSLGYQLIINGATADTSGITGGGPNTVIVGDLNYGVPTTNSNYAALDGAASVVAIGSGPAGTIPSSGTVYDSANNAVLAFFGTYNVDALGNSDVITSDEGSTGGVITAAGADDTIFLGAPPTAIQGSVTVPSTARVFVDAASAGTSTVNAGVGSSNFVVADTSTDFIATGGAESVVAAATGVLNFTSDGGTQTIFDNLGGSTITGGPKMLYFNDSVAAASTITGSTGGADTVWALATTTYDGANSASSFLAAGFFGASSATLAGASSVFTGSAGGSYTESTVSGSMIFLGNAIGQASSVVANDTLIGSSASQQLLNDVAWGNNRENLTIQQTGTETYNDGGTYVAFGSSDTLNATNSTGGDKFVVWNTAVNPGVNGGNFIGDTTIAGATKGDDLVALINGTVAGTGAAAAHTVDLQNWVSTDILNLIGYSTADATTALDALTAAKGGAASFTLSDGTTIKFDTTSNTNLFLNGKFFT